MEKYRGVDYLDLDRLLSDDEKLVRDSARDFVEREIEPIIVEAFRNEQIPAGMRRLMDVADEDVEFANVAVAVSRAYAKAQRDVNLRFLKAYIEGTRRFMSDKDFGMKTLSKYTGSRDQEILGKTYDLFATKYIKRNPALSLRGVEATLAMIADRSPKAKNRKAEESMDTSLMAELDKSGFLKTIWR
jgi:ABC-type nitrate/sulfonate/bicarbonate transport system substrate-binding protein